jgi:hypothetical protein
MNFEEGSLEVLKTIVRTAFKYGVSSGLHSSIPDLQRIKKSFVDKGLFSEAEEIDFIVNFLKKERDLAEEERQTVLKKTRELSKHIPIGMLISFRYQNDTLTGEVKGFLADRLLIMTKLRGVSRLLEVSPYDVKG